MWAASGSFEVQAWTGDSSVYPSEFLSEEVGVPLVPEVSEKGPVGCPTWWLGTLGKCQPVWGVSSAFARLCERLPTCLSWRFLSSVLYCFPFRGFRGQLSLPFGLCLGMSSQH